MRKVIFVLCVLYNLVVIAQDNAEKYQLRASKTQEKIQLDGQLTEAFWQNAQSAENFSQNFPEDSIPALDGTLVKIAFDDNFLYVGGICYEGTDKEDIVTSLRRDFSWSVNENFSIYIDPFNDYTNGFTFGLTPLGVQREGLVTNGTDVRTDWDNKWSSEVTRFDDRWEFEMAIPFKTLRYDDENVEWNIVLLRNNLKRNERSAWAVVPLGFRISAFAFAGRLTFDDPLPKAGTNLSVIPYVASGISRDYEANTPTEGNLQVGFDAKIGVSSSLNLDLTVNPDFSQVEVDRQVTNLSRFEINFPERRQFFLENQDLFGQGGFQSTRPFFSRRIGIAQDTSGSAIQVPITYGARLSGKVGQNWRVGFLNMQSRGNDAARLTGAEEISNTYKLLPQNYTVGVLQRQVFGQSNVSITAVNRQAINYDENDSSLSTTQFNRVVGVDYNLLSSDGRWQGDFYFHQSFDPVKKDDPISGGAFLRYNTTNFNIGGLTALIGEGYNAELGFVQRKDIVRSSIFTDYRFYPKEGGLINNHGPGLNYTYFGDLELNRTDLEYELSYQFDLNNTAEVELSYGHTYQLLRNDFEPIGDYVLPEGNEYDWRTLQLRFNTDQRKLLWFDANIQLGGFYVGELQRYRGSINYRFQPYVNLAIDFDHGRIDLPDRLLNDSTTISGKSNIWLVSPRADITFNDKLFLTTFLQYNQRSDNVNLNARLQWRFKPVSDLFLVYTDNYFPDTFASKSRALVFKLTYWLNL
ncbi:MAG: carbohydrate binding family 9 domain-containing protein [Cyclobacteriaceae bacterium]